MFKKTRFRLTLLGAGITILVLTAMSVLYLLLSEKNLREQDFLAFQQDASSLTQDLKEQPVISHEWLSTAEKDGPYTIRLWDNGIELLWGNHPQDAAKRALVDACLSYFSRSFEAERSGDSLSPCVFSFSFSSSDRKEADHYAYLASFPKAGGELTILILKSIEDLNLRLHRQRLSYLLPILFASAAVSLFFWYFTGKLLHPIEESRLSQSRFVAAASHELRTPLSVILSTSEACRRAIQADSSGRAVNSLRFLEIIEDESRLMSRLVADLLTLESADSQTLHLTKTACEADTLLLNTYEAFEPLAAKKGLALSVHLPEEPAAGSAKKTTPFRCDVDRIRQVLSILLHNALCYAPAGSRISLALTEKPDRVSFTVSDNGPGISDADKAHIFERFYRGDQARSLSGHFGLGLSIADEIACAHHGQLSVSDTPGGGATFTLTLPV